MTYIDCEIVSIGGADEVSFEILCHDGDGRRDFPITLTREQARDIGQRLLRAATNRCTDCKGTGYDLKNIDPDSDYYPPSCPTCKGAGK